LTYSNPDGYTTNLKPGAEGEYARYLADIIEHFCRNPDESGRIAFEYVSPVDEPQWNWSKPSEEGNGSREIQKHFPLLRSFGSSATTVGLSGPACSR